jgi:hypothetical protein
MDTYDEIRREINEARYFAAASAALRAEERETGPQDWSADWSDDGDAREAGWPGATPADLDWSEPDDEEDVPF